MENAGLQEACANFGHLVQLIFVLWLPVSAFYIIRTVSKK